jgi:hypothetical protein
MTTRTTVQITQALLVQKWRLSNVALAAVRIVAAIGSEEAPPEFKVPSHRSWCLTRFFKGGEGKDGIQETSRIGVAQAED